MRSWRLELADGKVSVTESDAAADCVVETTEDVLLRILSGKQNPALAYMTGKIKVEGRTDLARRPPRSDRLTISRARSRLRPSGRAA